jgi:hypothetical protein
MCPYIPPGTTRSARARNDSSTEFESWRAVRVKVISELLGFRPGVRNKI